MIIGVDVVFIHVKDPIAMAKWYRDTLDLEIGFKTPDHSWQEFEFASEKVSTRFALDYGGEYPSIVEQQGIMISLRVDNLHQMVEQLETKGIEFYGASKIIDVGRSYFATFRDPEDNWIQLSQRKYE